MLREIPIKDLLQKVKKAGELYAKAELPVGDGTQTAAQFARMRPGSAFGEEGLTFDAGLGA